MSVCGCSSDNADCFIIYLQFTFKNKYMLYFTYNSLKYARIDCVATIQISVVTL